MRHTETQELFASEFTYPIERERVIEAVGDVQLDAPAGDSETIADALARSGTTEFSSSEELYATTIGFLSEEYIGRKFYDDRASCTTSAHEDNVSF